MGFSFSPKKMVMLVFCGGFSAVLFAQTENATPAPLTREQRYAKVEPQLIYPLVKGTMMSGVLPVKDLSNRLDPNEKISLIFNFTQGTANKAQATHINEGLDEVARILNLHIAAGIKKENLKAVIVFHSAAVMSILSNDYYQMNYGGKNPNLDFLNQLKTAGVETVVCGQSLGLRGFTKSELLPQIQIAQSAITTLSKYQHKGYILFEIKEEK